MTLAEALSRIRKEPTTDAVLGRDPAQCLPFAKLEEVPWAEVVRLMRLELSSRS